MSFFRKNSSALTDFLILLLIAAAISGIAVFARFVLFGHLPTGNGEPVSYVLRLGELEDGVQTHLCTGDRAIDRQTRRTLGTVTEVRVLPAEREVYSESAGCLLHSVVPGRVDVLLTIRNEEGIAPAIGESVPFRTPDFFGNGTVEVIL